MLVGHPRLLTDPSPHRKRTVLTHAIRLGAAIVVAAVAGAGTATAATPRPPDAMFVNGYNKCKLTTLAALSKATGKVFTKAKFSGKWCQWTSADAHYVIQVDTHPLGYTEYGAYPIGKRPGGDVNSLINVPRASKAMLVTHSHALTGRYAKDVLAVYPQGVVSVSLL